VVNPSREVTHTPHRAIEGSSQTNDLGIDCSIGVFRAIHAWVMRPAIAMHRPGAEAIRGNREATNAGQPPCHVARTT
jgi:hypothetical protein